MLTKNYKKFSLAHPIIALTYENKCETFETFKELEERIDGMDENYITAYCYYNEHTLELIEFSMFGASRDSFTMTVHPKMSIDEATSFIDTLWG